MDKEDKIKELEEELEIIKQELIETKEHVKKYYENYKEEVIQKL
jgi:uncharacterized protein (DUF3084 family)